MSRQAQPQTDADVIVVGYGPVGQVLSTLLAMHGCRVVVAEQQPRPFPLPRAVAVDGYAARVLAAAGVGEALSRIGEPTPDYLVETSAGETLMRLSLATIGKNGWPESTSMYQPGLEAALAERGEELASLKVVRGRRVVEIRQQDAGVLVTLAGADGEAAGELTARFLVGCDGAGSTVRAALDPPIKDYGFEVDWLACDVVPFDRSAFPVRTLHIADPANPRVAVSAGPGHYRFEFLRLADEDPAAFDSAAGAWRRLASFGIDSGNARLERFATYRIRSRCAERWRSGRLLIAGDAAHEMPPFAGQGLSTGIADAGALAWRLSAVLEGASEEILDSYAAERLPRVRRSIDTSVRLGALICTTDPAAAAARDAAMLRSAGRTPPPAPDSITTGLLHRTPAGAPARFAGRLAPQHRGADEASDRDAGLGASDRDAGLGARHVLLARPPLADRLGADLGGELDRLRISVVAAGDGYHDWLDSLDGAQAALVRPDFYVFGVARDRDGLAGLISDLARQLGPR